MTAPAPGWDTVIGPGFTQALQEGLSRASRRPRPRVAAPALPPAAGVPAAREPIAVPSRAAAGRPTPQDRLEAVLCRFEAALPAALPPSSRADDALRRALTERARATLADALGIPAAPVRRGGGTPVRLGAVAVSLLMECAVLELSDSGCLTGAAVRALGTALREAAADTEAESRTGSGAAEADCCWHEQRWFSRELHDHVAVGITTARLLLAECDTAPGHAARAGGPDGRPADPRRFQRALRTLSEADARLRSLVFGTGEKVELPPLDDALRAFTEDAAPSGVEVSIRVTGNEALLPDAHRRDVFLTLREALRNSFDHARAEHVRVSVRTTRRWAYARVEDDGLGFDTQRALGPGHRHQGLRSMAERIEDIGGRLTVRSSPLDGTLVEAHLPLQPVTGHHPPVLPRHGRVQA
ncbi:sensor histidine kinase [Streptomyces sp. NPDC048337]|uniref:sensor histidine kinase n=1 Tax=Streptomyces sp. NPDC048337 TaxID=3365535 RepID=UPI00371F765E